MTFHEGVRRRTVDVLQPMIGGPMPPRVTFGSVVKGEPYSRDRTQSFITVRLNGRTGLLWCLCTSPGHRQDWSPHGYLCAALGRDLNEYDDWAGTIDEAKDLVRSWANDLLPVPFDHEAGAGPMGILVES